MALKQIVLRKKLEGLNAQLDTIRAKDADFLLRKQEIEKREQELEEAVSEVNDQTTADEQTALDEQIAAVESDQTALETEQTESEDAKKKLEGEIQNLQQELDELEKRSAVKAPAKRKDEEKYMRNRRFNDGMTVEQRSTFVTREDVKGFLVRVRELMGQKRAITGADLTIPEVMLELLRDNLHRYSKLVQYINVRQVNGKARQNVMGTIPEAVWTEACAKLNELVISFAQVEVDGYKVGGFVPVCNSTLEDSDENLSSEILDALGQAMGYATDKAILYGTGVKMPVGIATRLAQTSKPSDWNDNAPTWADLSSTNLLKINPSGMTAEAFFAALVLDLGVASNNYATGNTFWAMNRKTRMALMSKMINFNGAGALVAGQTGTMPVEGGSIVELPFIPDNDIIGGFGSLYLLAERSGAQLAQSEHVLFIEDQTVFKGTARYDGIPVFGEAFVVVNIANSAPTTSVLFPQDVANTVATPKALPIAGEFATSTNVFLSCDTPGAAIYYTVDGSAPTASKTAYNGPIALAATTTIKAIAIKTGMTDSAVYSGTFTKQ